MKSPELRNVLGKFRVKSWGFQGLGGCLKPLEAVYIGLTYTLTHQNYLFRRGI